jgi:antitoxin component YwqK of YwqJK toxin-antitoxin module
MMISCNNQQNENKLKVPPNLRILNTDTLLRKTDLGWTYKEEPFSGYMIQMENEREVYALPIIHGKEQGLAKGVYHTGEKLVECPFKNGKREGVFKQWWPNGYLRYLFYYEADHLEGKAIVFYPDARRRQENNYHQGLEEGLQRYWDDNGELISNYTVKENKTYGYKAVKNCIPTTYK